jgi:type II secretory pathway predicted ATPase ExeA
MHENDNLGLLSNIEKPNKKLINVLIVGKNELNDLLKTNKVLRQRITISYRIEPLTENETEEYILHRLKIADSKSRIFSPEAFQEVLSFNALGCIEFVASHVTNPQCEPAQCRTDRQD